MKKLMLCFILILTIFTLSGCGKTEIIKDTITQEKEIIVDYSSSISFEKALNEEEETKGKNVKVLISEIIETSDKEIKYKAGNNLILSSDTKNDISKNDYIVIKILNEPNKIEDYWQIEFELIKLIKSENNNEEESESNENVVADDKIKIDKESANYVGLDKNDIEKELKSKGFTNIEFKETKTTDSNNKDNTIISITINEKEFKKEDEFKKDDKITITYWKYEKPITSQLVLPKDGSKLAKDFDSEGKSTIYYINVDGTKNVPTIKKWETATVTDGVAEYLDYLKELGFKISITDSNVKEPYKGFKLYETKFSVEGEGCSWTMFLSIQDEKYVEYELDINR